MSKLQNINFGISLHINLVYIYIYNICVRINLSKVRIAMQSVQDTSKRCVRAKNAEPLRSVLPSVRRLPNVFLRFSLKLRYHFRDGNESIGNTIMLAMYRQH